MNAFYKRVDEVGLVMEYGRIFTPSHYGELHAL